jgi:hypothetical protein
VTDPAAASRRAAAGLALLAGLALFLLLHLFFFLAWDAVFAPRPWPGYEDAMRSGTIEPWFVHSPASLWLTRAVVFAAALAIALASHRARWSNALAFWAGTAGGVVVTYATTTVRSLPWGWLGFVLYPLRVLIPVVLGTALGELARRTILPPRRA